MSNDKNFLLSEYFNSIVDDVLKRNIHPEDSFEVAALLESMGWNDKRAQDHFGVTDLFELADRIWEYIQNHISVTPFDSGQKDNKVKLFFELFKSFLRGLIFALPMAISVISMLTLKFSLWSYEYLTVE